MPWFLLSNAERRIPSSLSGLLVATVPLIAALGTYLTGQRRGSSSRPAVAGVFIRAGPGRGGRVLLGLDGAPGPSSDRWRRCCSWRWATPLAQLDHRPIPLGSVPAAASSGERSSLHREVRHRLSARGGGAGPGRGAGRLGDRRRRGAGRGVHRRGLRGVLRVAQRDASDAGHPDHLLQPGGGRRLGRPGPGRVIPAGHRRRAWFSHLVGSWLPPGAAAASWTRTARRRPPGGRDGRPATPPRTERRAPQGGGLVGSKRIYGRSYSPLYQQ